MDPLELTAWERHGLQVAQQLLVGGDQGGSVGARTDSDESDAGGAGSTLGSGLLAVTR
jgi:hypothetical protein